MKTKTLFLLACLMLSVLPANAQLGGALIKAAKKAAQKTTEKLTDKAAESASDAIVNELDKNKENNTVNEEQITYIELMRQLPELPTAQQLVNYKEAELNEQSLKLLVSPVTAFQTKLLNLSMQALSIPTADIDSAQLSEAAYKQAELATGLSREELEYLSTLPEDQQQAYLQKHYKKGTAESALLKQAADASEYLKPVQPLIDMWIKIDNQIDQLFNETTNHCKDIYGQYANQLAKANGKERNKTLIKYYAEIAPILLSTVKQAMEIRINEQLPLAEEIENQMAPIRAEHRDLISSFLNYPQLTASQYFSDPSHLFDIPE